VKDVLSVVGPQTAAALSAVALGFGVQQVLLVDLPQLARFFVSAPICLAIYLTVAVGIFKVTRPLELAFSLVRDFSRLGLRGSS
jgi:PST family polysaccharide transporter